MTCKNIMSKLFHRNLIDLKKHKLKQWNGTRTDKSSICMQIMKRTLKLKSCQTIYYKLWHKKIWGGK